MKHVSDIKKYERCEKLLWCSKRHPQPFQAYIVYNENIIDLSLKRLHIESFFMGQANDENSAFFTHKEQYTNFINMRFEYQDLRVKIPIMIKVDDGYHVYYPYATCFPKEGEAQTMADNEWVLNNLGIQVTKRFCIHLNCNYIRHEDLNLEELLLVQDFLFNDRNRPASKIDELVKAKGRDLTPILSKMDEVLKKDEIIKPRTNICTRRNKCMYFDYCFEEKKDTSIFHLVSSAKKFELYEQGIKTIDELDFDCIEGTRHQFAQYMAAKKNALFFDGLAVEGFFKQVTYPISYLDFEWETFAFPPYENMHPYDVLTFQYSLHIEHQDGGLKHKEFLGKNDCRIDFIEKLIEDIPKQGSIICYNVEGAEKLRLKQLAKQFPQYEKPLKAIWERMVDLATPFSSGLIYDNQMAGMYSLKKLVSIFTDYSYDDLEISHGMDAVRKYVNLQNDADPEIIDSLLKYCAMDTYAMYLIYHWILEQLK
ncbi:hypothetical protein M2475_000050 [Breznakia sp. PF5-3]|uniref:DUF2779 domain-containing protein n=1 Tax=unclassified Breznakia TaxID=2623764 RepID=UPI0024053A0E|nr:MULTISPECIES: DUF2779 domain-containing protein [unclassified Breznakia]MDF9823703.1 hypothetical protein [Breznakia sp. PM6-1]MDF9834501.1 hypothetical protein [Breznakia sp. PF5-3]MDF9837528.1 hypothetical protein [Breznakia sp. PFB2-8]MDF9859105.1 hypothetical protein [Breznakia sp. PH5-24]